MDSCGAIRDWTEGCAKHYVSRMSSESQETLAQHFLRLVDVVARLRGPGGCPWDQEQTQLSLTPFILEEAHELVEALESGDREHIIEELGDFMFQVILQAQIARDLKQFDIQEVVQKLSDKMIRRHPHVFGCENWSTSEEVLVQWDSLKASEKSRPLFNYPVQLPALQAAHKAGAKSAQWNFDWNAQTSRERILSVLAKVEEEVRELREAIAQAPELDPQTFQHQLENKEPAHRHIFHEMGDTLFALSQLARHLGFQAEASLREANRRFQRRFESMIEISQFKKEDFQKLSPQQMEDAWMKAKAKEAKNEI